MTHRKVCTRTLDERKLEKDQLGKDEREARKSQKRGIQKECNCRWQRLRQYSCMEVESNQ
jgi:hypothetical protein